jgi:hypothetical protein
MMLTSLHIAYVRYGPDRTLDPHLTQIVPGAGSATLCGRPVVGYGSMAPDDSLDWTFGTAICETCRKVAIGD